MGLKQNLLDIYIRHITGKVLLDHERAYKKSRFYLWVGPQPAVAGYRNIAVSDDEPQQLGTLGSDCSWVKAPFGRHPGSTSPGTGRSSVYWRQYLPRPDNPLRTVYTLNY